jgi:hypothetical protein
VAQEEREVREPTRIGGGWRGVGVYAIEKDSNHLSVFRKSCLKSSGQVRGLRLIDNLILITCIRFPSRLSSLASFLPHASF